METSIRRLLNTRRPIAWSERSLSGKFSSRWSKLWELYITKTSCIVISKVPMFSCKRMETQNLVIWTSLRLLKKDFYTHRLVHHIMRVLRSGKTSPTAQRVIFGLSVAFYTRCVHLNHPSELTTWTVFTNAFWKDHIHLLTGNTRKSW